MVTVDEAKQIIKENLPKPEEVLVNLSKSFGKTLSAVLASSDNIPAYDNSAMDGYAIRSADVVDADADSPAMLSLSGVIPAGTKTEIALEENCAIKIMTGAMVPSGADSVVRVEDTVSDGEKVSVLVPVPEGSNIRRAGEDIQSGTEIFQAGRFLSPADIGILASIGISKVPIYKRPEVGFITTGSELIEPDEELGEGLVRNSNKYSILSLFKKERVKAKYVGHAGDDKTAIKNLVSKGLESDVLVTSGGVSVGDFDYMKNVLTELGMVTHFWKIQQKPGKPFLFGTVEGKPVFGLPGNPVSAYVTCFMYVLPAVRMMMGVSSLNHAGFQGKLLNVYAKKQELTHFARGYYIINDAEVSVTPLEKQGSGILRSLSEANCIIQFSESKSEYAIGDLVTILPL